MKSDWRRFFRRGSTDAEQRDELDFYVDVTAEEYVAGGMDPAAARAEARRKLGNTRIREEVYTMNSFAFSEAVLRDARYALRLIAAKPAFSAAVLLSLALGIGANIAIFTVVHAILIRPLPYPAAGALVGVYNSSVIHGESFHDMPLSPLLFTALEPAVRSFETLGVWTPQAVTLSGAGDPEEVASVVVSQGVLPALGVVPTVGRWFSKYDDSPASERTAILSYACWQRKYGGDPRILDRSILVDLLPRRVIGVMPRGFRFLDLAPDAFLPYRIGAQSRVDEFNANGIARLRPGVSIAQANRDIADVLANPAIGPGPRYMAQALHIQPDLRPLQRDIVGDVAPVLSILMGALILVLLLVCANVANLVLVRAQSRRQEFAIRAALGAGWSRIARELIVESLVLGALGGAFGFALAWAGLRALVAYGPANLPRLAEVSIDGSSVAFALACSLASSLLFGAISVFKCGRPSKLQNARGASTGAAQLRGQHTLVVAQVALALVLVIGAGLLIRSFVAMRNTAPGFTHPERIQTVRLTIPAIQIPEPERVARMQADLVARLSAIPGVEAAGFANGLPMELEYRNGMVIAVEGRTAPDQMPPNRSVRQVSPGLFAVLGTRFLAGRDFTWGDVFDIHRVAIVSENMARENWGSARDAIGKRIRIGNDSPWMEVVGVVENVLEDGVRQAAPTMVYMRAGVDSSHGIRHAETFAIRTPRAGTESLLREVASAIHAVNPSLPLAKVRTLEEPWRQTMARTSFALVLLGIAGAMAVILAIVGVYGVLAFAVAQRTREVGIRVALGAGPRSIRSLFVRQGALLACAGGVIGLAASAFLSRWLASLLFGVKPLDAATYAAAAAVLIAAALAASYLPARRAAAIDPMESLRAE